jgi:hypothetical protein
MSTQNQAYKIFKQRLTKLPAKARKVVTESVLNNKEQFKQYIKSKNSNIINEANKKSEFVSKRLFLSLIDAGYDDVQSEKFVDFLMNGNYQKFIDNANSEIEKTFEKSTPGKTQVMPGRRQESGTFSRRGGGSGGRRGSGVTPDDIAEDQLLNPKKDYSFEQGSNDPFGEKTEKGNNKTKNFDSNKAKEMKLTKKSSIGDKLKSTGKKALDAVANIPGKKFDKYDQMQVEKPMGHYSKKKKPVQKKNDPNKKGIMSKAKDAVKKGANKVKDFFSKKEKQKIEESITLALKNNDFKKLTLIKERMEKIIAKRLLNELQKVNKSTKSVVKEGVLDIFKKKQTNKEEQKEKPIEFNAAIAAKLFAEFQYESGECYNIELDENNNKDFASIYCYYGNNGNELVIHKYNFKDGFYRNVTTGSPAKKFPMDRLS